MFIRGDNALCCQTTGELQRQVTECNQLARAAERNHFSKHITAAEHLPASVVQVVPFYCQALITQQRAAVGDGLRVDVQLCGLEQATVGQTVTCERCLIRRHHSAITGKLRHVQQQVSGL